MWKENLFLNKYLLFVSCALSISSFVDGGP